LTTPDERLAHLETVVRALAREVEELRAELNAERPAPSRRDATPHAPGAATADEPAWMRAHTDSVARGGPPTGTVTPPALGATTEPPRSEAAARAPRPASRPPSATLDLESLVGRYGAMALAALTIIMGVGALLRWAVEHVEIGPATRVALGALLAAALAAAGWWLRGRGERAGAAAAAASRRYGNTILGLALAVVHVDAWGAGPYLHVVSPAVALWVAALASAALATLAFSSGEQTLFAVGLGGALLAPFVTSTGGGTVPALVGYGLVVVVGGCLALGTAAARGQRWTVARTILGVGGGAYALAALALGAPGGSWALQSAPPAYAVLAAWSALALAGGAHRAPLARAFLLAAFVALAARAMDLATGGAPAPDVAAALVAVGALGAATAFAAARAVEVEGDASALFWGALLPIGFLCDALVAVPDSRGVPGVATAAGWTLLGVAAAWLAGPRRRQPPLVAAALATSAAIILGADAHPVLGVALLATQGALVALLAARLAARGERAQLVLIPSVLALAGAGWWAGALLEQRTPYAYTPFATLPSLAALAAVAGWTAFGLVVARVRWVEWGTPGADSRAPEGAPLGGSLTGLGAVAAFLWGREELAHAFSADFATFLLIGYYAAAGVAAIVVGRLRAAAGPRRAGLALAVYAALKALAEASGLADVALRVGSYLLVGLFLLAVAYWYRGGAEEEPLAVGR
jgi:uncharacterized membrane protein